MELAELILDRLPPKKRKELLHELVLQQTRPRTKGVVPIENPNDPDQDNEVDEIYSTYPNEGLDPEAPSTDDSDEEHDFDFYYRAMDEVTPQTSGGDW